ncbi:MAG: flagellin, partial [Planctomycetaceae bacterium]|nr:flagellin [Planctomycetaceae bacterium]
MTGLYVASNVQSLISQNQLNRSMSELGEILTRLSTGLRINSGKDDPAGLIASELIKSDMTATAKAITNTERANSMIAIADSAMGQVSALLNDIRGLVNEAANTGAMTPEQIAANQLQVDASLDSIDRIAKTTNYQGQLLLDGSMGFQTAGIDNSAVKDFNIYQANFGTQSQIDVDLNVLRDAGYAQLFYDKASISDDVVIEVTGNQGSDNFKFQAGASVGDVARAVNQVSDTTGVRAVVGAEATAGQIMITSAGFENDLNLTSLMTGANAGNYTVKFTAGTDDETTYTITDPQGDKPGIINFKLKMQEKSAPSATGFDESYNGIYSYDITGDTSGGGIVVQSEKGQQIRQVEFVKAGTDADGISSDGHTSAEENGGVAATFDKKSGKLQILYRDGATDEAVKRAIDAVDGLRYISGSVSDEEGYFNPADLRANNALNIKATIEGSKFENTDIVYVYDESVADLGDNERYAGDGGDVALAYKDGAQYAAATVKWGTGEDTDPGDLSSYNVQLRIVAKQVGAGLNDVAINFEQDNTYAAGDVSAVYDTERKVLHIRGQIDNQDDATKNATYGSLKAAIDAASPFRADITILDKDDEGVSEALDGKPLPLSTKIKAGLLSDEDTGITPNTGTDSSFIKTGQIYGDIGTDHQALFVRVSSADVTAQDIVSAFNDTENAPFSTIAANFTVSNAVDSNGTGTIFNDTLDNPTGSNEDIPSVKVRVSTGVLTGGADGYTTAVTANELVDFINCDETLSQMFYAQIPDDQSGTGLLTLFDEAAYYGDPDAETALQFLGPEGSPDILFVTDGPDACLDISFSSAAGTECAGDGRPIASLQAKNANAAFTVQALQDGDQYDGMAVRMIRLDNNHIVEEDDEGNVTRDDSYVQYKAGPSNAMAYCSIDDKDTGTVIETGKFIVYGVNGGTDLNNVSIVAKLDESQTESATARYDEVNKRLYITVNSSAATVEDGGVTLSDAVAAINNTGLFRAEYDYSFNVDPGDGEDDTGPGLETFGSVFTAARELEIGNTGNSGGHNGVLEVYVAGNAQQITSQRVVDAINRDTIAGKAFVAQTLGGTDAGTGIIDFREDN